MWFQRLFDVHLMPNKRWNDVAYLQRRGLYFVSSVKLRQILAIYAQIKKISKIYPFKVHNLSP